MFEAEETSAKAIVFGKVTPEVMPLREQCIGEARAYGAFESTIRAQYEELVRQATELKKA